MEYQVRVNGFITDEYSNKNRAIKMAWTRRRNAGVQNDVDVFSTKKNEVIYSIPSANLGIISY